MQYHLGGLIGKKFGQSCPNMIGLECNPEAVEKSP